MRDIPDIYFDLISTVEGDKLVGYPDSGDRPTVGRGHTGPEVYVGMVISEDESKHLCAADSHTALARLYAAAPASVLDTLPNHKFSALLSFVYNLGADPDWTIWKDLKAGNLADVPTQLMRFDKIKNPKTGAVETVPGLIHRRLAERTFWECPDPDSVPAALAQAASTMAAAPQIPSSSVTRDAVTPPAPAQPAVPAMMSRTKWAAGLVAVLGLASASQGFIQSAQTTLDGAGLNFRWLATFDHYSGALIGGLGVAIMVLRTLDEQLKAK